MQRAAGADHVADKLASFRAGISTNALSRSSRKKAKEKSMKTLTTIAVIAFLLMPSIAEACSDHKRKPVKSSGYANINGTTKSTCR